MQVATLFYASALGIVASVVLGGGTHGGFLSDAVLQLICVPLLIAALWRALAPDANKSTRWAILVCLAVAAIPMLQLLPLPARLWAALPGRAVAADGLNLLLPQLPSQPLSLAPSDTWQALVSLVPPVAIFLAVVQLQAPERRRLSLVLLAIGVVSLFLGLLQVAQGANSPLRFFEFTNPSEAVGFFANRNHFAALLYCLIPIAAAWLFDAAGASRPPGSVGSMGGVSVLPLAACFAVLIALVAAQSTIRSRAGMGLTMVAVLGAVGLGLPEWRRGTRSAAGGAMRIVTGAAVVAGILAVQFSLLRIMERFEADPLIDGRIIFGRNATASAKALMPFGSGVGTFVPTYATFEPVHDVVGDIFANRAHNDLIEALMESGLAGAVAMIVLMCLLLWRAVDIWRPRIDASHVVDRLLPRAATIMIALLLIHSFYDYPLRTGAIMAVFAFGSAMLWPAPAGGSEVGHGATRKAQQKNAGGIPSSRRARPAADSEQIAGAPADPSAASGHAVDKTGSSLPTPQPGAKWGTDVEWPEAWREKPKSHENAEPMHRHWPKSSDKT